MSLRKARVETVTKNNETLRRLLAPPKFRDTVCRHKPQPAPNEKGSHRQTDLWSLRVDRKTDRETGGLTTVVGTLTVARSLGRTVTTCLIQAGLTTVFMLNTQRESDARSLRQDVNIP